MLRILVPVILLLAVVAAGAAVLSARPQIDNARSRAETAWNDIDARIGPHYRLLGTAAARMAGIIGPERALATETRTAIARWRAARGGPLAREVAAANAVEAVGRRLVLAADTSEQVKANRSVAVAIDAYAADPTFTATALADPVGRFERAVDRYERARTGPVQSLAAQALRARPIPAFTPVPSTG